MDDDKKREEIAKLKVERLKTLASLFVGVCSSIGVVGVFAYCFLIAGFVPIGLSAGDTLFFVFVMLAFAMTGAVLAIFGLFVYVPYVLQKPTYGASTSPIGLTRGGGVLAIFAVAMSSVILFFFFFTSKFVDQQAGDAGFSYGWMAAIVACLAVYWLIANWLVQSLTDALSHVFLLLLFSSLSGLLAASASDGARTAAATHALMVPAILLLSGLFLAFSIASLSPPTVPGATAPAPAKIRTAAAFAAIGILLPYIAAVTGVNVMNTVMQGLGLRADAATLIVNSANFQTMQAAADAKGVLLYSCKADGDTYAVSYVRILWHGMGQRSYVELSPSEADKHAGVRVELDSAGVKKSQSQHMATCVELKRGIYFKSDSKALDDKQWEMTLPFILNFMRSVYRDGNTVIAVGYADPMPRKEDSNFTLAQERACNVIRKLGTHPEFKDKKAWTDEALIDVRLESDATSSCSALKEAADRQSCFERNRRVELQLVQADGAFFRVGTAKFSEACETKSAK
nr:hypothetical protein [uncultured Massilia sp.]